MAFAEILVFAATLARETFAVSASAARRGRRRVLATCAFGIGFAGIALATVVSHADEPQYDEAAALAARVLEQTGRIELPEGFQLAQASPLEPLGSHVTTVFVDAAGLHLGGRTFDLDDAPVAGSCSVPTSVVQALEWERRVSAQALEWDRRVALGSYPRPKNDWPPEADINLAIDARTPYRNVVAAWRWLACEGFLPALVMSEPSGARGALRFDSFTRGGYDVLIRLDVAPDGYRVERASKRDRQPWRWWILDDEMESYGAACTVGAEGAEGASVSLRGDEGALAECVLRAMDEEAKTRVVSPSGLASLGREASKQPPPPPPTREELRARLYPTCGNSAALAFAVSATPEMTFRDVTHAVLSAKPVLTFAGFSMKP